MIELSAAIKTWGSTLFKETLKREIEQLDPSLLPLQQGLTQGNHVASNKHSAMILNIKEEDGHIRAKVGIFFTSLIAGCNCADDPSPGNELSEYCELMFDINTNTMNAQVNLLDT